MYKTLGATAIIFLSLYSSEKAPAADVKVTESMRIEDNSADAEITVVLNFAPDQVTLTPAQQDELNSKLKGSHPLEITLKAISLESIEGVGVQQHRFRNIVNQMGWSGLPLEYQTTFSSSDAELCINKASCVPRIEIVVK